jgi:hypothetical protein
MRKVGKLAAGWKALFAAAIGLGAAGIIAAHAFAGGSTLTVGHVTLLPGEEAQLQLKASDIGAPGLGAWQVDIDYDADVVTPASCTAGPSGICNVNFARGTVRVVGADASGIRGNVTLATLRFRCDVEGASALALTAVEFADATTGAPQPLAIGVQHGSVNCLAPEPPPANLNGDANCDQVVNSIDALIVLQYVARLRSSVPCPDLADYNHDGRITSVDAALILQDDAGLI